MSGRSKRRSTAQASELSLRAQKEKTLSNVDRLLLAQAVYEVGADAWPQVAKLLSNHPLIVRPKMFNAQTCRGYYHNLMSSAGLESTDSCSNPKAPTHLQLAQLHYTIRMNELKGLVIAEEEKFKNLVREIEDIRLGKWDDKIRDSLENPEGRDPVEGGRQEGFEPPKPISPQGSGPPSPTLERDSLQRNGQDEERTASPEAEASAVTHDDMDMDISASEKVHREEQDISVLISTDLNPGEDLIRRQGTGSPEPEVKMNSPSGTNNDDETHQRSGATKAEPSEEEPLHNTRGASRKRRASIVSSQTRSLRTSRHHKPAEEQPDADRSSARSKRKFSTTDVDPPRQHKRPREDSEPVEEDEPAPSSSKISRRQAQREEKIASKRFQNVIGLLHEQISRHRNGTIFHNPIKKSEAPDYRDIVKRPMDLKTIKAKVKDGSITNSLEFQRDIYLMFANAMMYNRPGSDVYEMAESMMYDSEREMQAFRETEGFHRTSR